ncbi:hypothetical protein DBR43_08170 [Pedobacter sp. KBW06]|uniref:hypothetical protein n=1 Tax=Pedobacter sp. KBW06 TaxID=2153359 RepID=UPI000F5A7950|nr:hypothetical protein [Pedobacter sp. KBW06]RQO75323.1 hypothetical protein DBR43_08170 [Pedobacter sp. KBW06]
MQEALDFLKEFVEGKVSGPELEATLSENSGLEMLLSDDSLNWTGTYVSASGPFLYLAALNLKTIVGCYDAQGLIQLFLTKKEISFSVYKGYEERYSLILETQPGYIDADTVFVEKYILPAAEGLKVKSEIKQAIKGRFNELFRYHKKAPKWIQSPQWIIKEDRPLFFLGQFEIKDCQLFKDNGFVYLFVNEDNGAIESVKQFY